LVTPGENGIIVPPRDASALGDAMREALHASWSREAIRASGTATSWDTVAQRVLSVFQKVLS